MIAIEEYATQCDSVVVYCALPDDSGVLWHGAISYSGCGYIDILIINYKSIVGFVLCG